MRSASLGLPRSASRLPGPVVDGLSEHRIREGADRVEHGREVVRQERLQMMLVAPPGPAWLLALSVAAQAVGQRGELDASVLCHDVHSILDEWTVDVVLAAEEIDVGKVPPSGVRLPTGHCSDDLLRVTMWSG